MAQIRKIFLIILLLFLWNCSTSAPKFDEKFNQLSANMSTDKVNELLGPPDLKELKNGVEIWNYDRAQGRYVQFKNGGVISFGRGVLALPAPANSPAVNPTPFVLKSIGDVCKEDEDCASKNCHFKVCSGKNNCSVPEGKLCGNNNDCCTSFCDFGICRKRK